MIGSRLPFLFPWFRIHLLIREIRTTNWDSATWPTARQALKDIFALHARMRRWAWWNQDLHHEPLERRDGKRHRLGHHLR